MNYINYRSEQTLDPNADKRIRTIKKFKDLDVIDLISGIQGGMRSTFILYFNELVIMRGLTSASSSDGMIESIGGEEKVRGVTDSNSKALARVMNSISTPDELINIQTVKAVVGIFPGLTVDLIVKVLDYLARNSHRKDVIKFFTNAVIFNQKYLTEQGVFREHKDDTAYQAVKIRGAYTSSRTTDKTVIELRRAATKYSKKATSRVNKQVLSSIRNGLLVYIFLFSQKG